MSTSNYAFPRDDQEELPATRSRGRVVPIQPPQPQEEEPALDIIVNGVVFGTVYPRQLKAKAQIALERCRTALSLLTWCQVYGGVDNTDASRDERNGKTDLDRLEDDLGEMEIGALLDLILEIGTTLGEAMQLPKRKARR